MKVHSPALDAYVRTSVQPVGGSAPPPPAASSEAVSSEAAQVTITAAAREKAAESAAGIDEKKVSSLKQQIQEGTYRVNPQILAARLLDKLG
jgi:flagellar biosynthesis anti-sigma factor FlgM